eukprot:433-Eustigmatos_ZCMA.PRE.1
MANQPRNADTPIKKPPRGRLSFCEENRRVSRAHPAPPVVAPAGSDAGAERGVGAGAVTAGAEA